MQNRQPAKDQEIRRLVMWLRRGRIGERNAKSWNMLIIAESNHIFKIFLAQSKFIRAIFKEESHFRTIWN